VTFSNHIRFCRRGLGKLNEGYISLDASRPWLCYWITHALDLLKYDLTAQEQDAYVGTANDGNCALP
jgi:protein farnesyltransferase subunit beta